MPGKPAAVLGDKIMGQCIGHKIPSPPAGNPAPAPPMPFSAPVTLLTAKKTFINKKLAVVEGSQGLNVPPHVGLHPVADNKALPPAQIGKVKKGSSTVKIEGKPAARTGDVCEICFGPVGKLVGSSTNVLIGG